LFFKILFLPHSLKNGNSREAETPQSILCPKTNFAYKINFKKVFTFAILYDIIPFAHARFSGCGVNLSEVITCRILGFEANILMR